MEKGFPSGGRWHTEGVTDEGLQGVSKYNVYLTEEKKVHFTRKEFS